AAALHTIRPPVDRRPKRPADDPRQPVRSNGPARDDRDVHDAASGWRAVLRDWPRAARSVRSLRRRVPADRELDSVSELTLEERQNLKATPKLARQKSSFCSTKTAPPVKV